MKLGNKLFTAAYGDGIFVSSNNGTNWARVDSGLRNTVVWSLALCGSRIFAGTAGGLFVSSDEGGIWCKSDSGMPKDEYIMSLMVDGPNLFAGVGAGPTASGAGVFCSVDSGKTWTSGNNGLAGLAVTALFMNEGRIFASTNIGLYLSVDHGGSWYQPAPRPMASTYINGFARYEDRVFAATRNGPFFSTDNGVNWTPTGAGIIGTQVFTLANGDGEIFAGGYSGIAKTTDTGTSWGMTDTALARFEIQSIAVSGTTMLVGTRYGGGFRSTDNGKNWSLVIPGSGDPWVQAIAVIGDNIFVGMNSFRVLRSTDNGASWDGLPGSPSSGRCFAFKEGNLFVGARSCITRSTDGGMSWAFADTGAGGATALAVIGTRIYAAGGGVFVSTNNGSRWRKVDSGLTDLNVNCLTVSGNNLFAGTMDGGIFVLKTPDTVWTCVNSVSEGRWFGSSGSMNTWTNALMVSDGYLLAGTDKTGVWRRPLSEMVTGLRGGGSMAPAAFTLYQNYPNPFNPATTIRHSLPHKSQVLLSVYNTLGQLVATLVQGQQEAGAYDVKFYGSALASGVYFYRLQTGSYVDTKKLLLLR